MSEGIPECSEENRGRRDYYRTEVHRLLALNGTEKVIEAIKVTRDIYNLKPFQPPDLQRLLDHLEQQDFNIGSPDLNFVHGVDILTGSYLLDKRRWHQVLAEWEL